MHFLSTREGLSATLSEALIAGLAPDGGLYVPASFPQVDGSDFKEGQSLSEVAQTLLQPFFAGDGLEGLLREICDETFHFDIPLRQLNETTSVLELFHGPTAAFKDVGAGFLASSLSRLSVDGERARTVLVATSGDTGSAVAAAFYKKPNVDVVILYPKGKVSPRQEAQLTCWDENVRTFRTRGVFDDCQRIVKEAFADEALRQSLNLTTANSINIGRLLPQMVYYAFAATEHYRREGQKPGFIVPSGNLGNVIACLYARECGLPIGKIVLAVNQNEPVRHYLETGVYKAFETVSTLANAMDVGHPSNMERLRALWPDIDGLRDQISVVQVSDSTIEAVIRDGQDHFGEVWDPHTACAVAARQSVDDTLPWILVSTAHPAKFESIVEPLIGKKVPVPDPLQELLHRPDRAVEIDATLAALKAELP